MQKKWQPPQRKKRLEALNWGAKKRLEIYRSKTKPIAETLAPLLERLPSELKKKKPNKKAINKCEFLASEMLGIISATVKQAEILLRTMQKQNKPNLEKEKEKMAEIRKLAIKKRKKYENVLRQIQYWKKEKGIEW